MAVATERKQAVLRSLVDTTSRHLLLLMVGSQEKQRLMALKEELEQTKRYLEGHVDAINTRVNRWGWVWLCFTSMFCMACNDVPCFELCMLLIIGTVRSVCQ